MSYIYLITNTINGKQYVGKTEYDNIEKRWKQHCSDYLKECNFNRPLYKAMNKYGLNAFIIEPIEYVSIDKNLEEREIYWIQYYNTYKNGYNATLGGDGKHYLDYNLIKDLWDKGYSCTQIGDKLKNDATYIGVIIKKFGVTEEEIQKRAIQKISKRVIQIDKNTKEIINEYSSCREAARAMINNNYTHCKESTGSTHISEVCRGKRQTFAGFCWAFI